VARRSKAALQFRRDLDKELADSSKEAGVELTWSATERFIIEQIMDCLDKKAVLEGDWQKAADAEARVKISTEVRLLQGHIERLLRKVDTDPPVAKSKVSHKASYAANVRWGNGRAV
jgi:hypothetical protein